MTLNSFYKSFQNLKPVEFLSRKSVEQEKASNWLNFHRDKLKKEEEEELNQMDEVDRLIVFWFIRMVQDTQKKLDEYKYNSLFKKNECSKEVVLFKSSKYSQFEVLINKEAYEKDHTYFDKISFYDFLENFNENTIITSNSFDKDYMNSKLYKNETKSLKNKKMGYLIDSFKEYIESEGIQNDIKISSGFENVNFYFYIDLI